MDGTVLWSQSLGDGVSREVEERAPKKKHNSSSRGDK